MLCFLIFLFFVCFLFGFFFFCLSSCYPGCSAVAVTGMKKIEKEVEVEIAMDNLLALVG